MQYPLVLQTKEYFHRLTKGSVLASPFWVIQTAAAQVWVGPVLLCNRYVKLHLKYVSGMPGAVSETPAGERAEVGPAFPGFRPEN
jgi:hypothetical protein